MNLNRRSKKSISENRIATELYHEYIAGVIAMNRSVKIKAPEGNNAGTMECGDPIQASFNAGRLKAIRDILIKYYGFSLADIEAREKWEIEHDEV